MNVCRQCLIERLAFVISPCLLAFKTLNRVIVFFLFFDISLMECVYIKDDRKHLLKSHKSHKQLAVRQKVNVCERE